MGLPPAPPAGTDGDLDARAQAWIERCCVDQGLPVRVTDPRKLAEVAELLGLRATQGRKTARTRDSSKPLKPRRPGPTST
jgi:hypothetical protein